jgi:putative ATP-dependent endonuclease of the OLD family
VKISEITIHNFRSIAESTFCLGDYSLLIGANNAGKSNVIDALRAFYEKIKFEDKHDFPKFKTDDDESWMDIEFVLTSDEYLSLKDEYKRSESRLKVRKYFKTKQKGKDGKVKQGIYAYTGDQLSDDFFYGAKNVQQGKLGDIIYIEAVSRLDEHTKLTGPSPLRELLQSIMNKLVASSVSFNALTEEFQTFAKKFKTEETEDQRSLLLLEREINEDITDWDAEFVLQINPISQTDMVKNLISYNVVDRILGEALEAKQFGQGFQRHLIFSLIRRAAVYQSISLPTNKKDFSPSMTLLLFEEPEAFLHPTQQSVLCRSLQLIGSQEGNQVLISSHSTNFVSYNADDITSIIRLCRQKDRTVTGQIMADDLNRLFNDNQQINSLLNKTKKKIHEDDMRNDMEAVKYFLWLNPERCGMFFAGQVLLVEGTTERVILNYLFNTGQIDTPPGGIFVLDCIGKYNIHRFMNLLGPLKVTHSVLCDCDNGQGDHPIVMELIEGSKNDFTYKIVSFEIDFEDFLGIKKGMSPHRKPQHAMLKLKDGSIPPEKMDSLKKVVQDLIR